VLDRLAVDPMSLARELDWVIKRQLIENYMAKHSCEWSDSRVAMIDLQYHDIRPSKGLYYKLEESDAVRADDHRGRGDQGHLRPAPRTPGPTSGACACRKYADEVVSASLGLGDLRSQGGAAEEDLHARAPPGHRGPCAAAVRGVGHRGAPCSRTSASRAATSRMLDDRWKHAFFDYSTSSFAEILQARRPSTSCPGRSEPGSDEGERPLGAARHHGAGPALPRRG